MGCDGVLVWRELKRFPASGLLTGLESNQSQEGGGGAGVRILLALSPTAMSDN